LLKTGLPACRAEILPIGLRTCRIGGLYNLTLALHFWDMNLNPSDEIVLNDANFDENGRILLLTGPNRGGKTVFTEATGLAQLLFQSGVFVPGGHAAISPVDGIFSHFPVDENQTIELGRLGEETKRLNDIFRHASRHSLILLNESLSSTSYLEGLYIAKDVVKSLRYLETRAVFNTHMHELAGHSEQFNIETTGDSLVISLVTGLTDGQRSFRVQPGAPLGKSYAMDIARKFGISFEQLALEIDARRQERPSDA
jgi:DNA mismatch repair ATPase MutS